MTKVSKVNHASRGLVRGGHVRFIHGHHSRKHAHGYTEENRGYGTPCWIWNGRESKGYARTWHDGKERSAHIVFYEKRYGLVPEGLQLDHLCEQTNCVRPDHLEAVTTTENTRRGNRAKLSTESVQAARILNSAGWTHERIGRLFNVSRATTGYALRGVTWKDVA